MDELKQYLFDIVDDSAAAVTYTQGGREWFIVRKFSLTASPAEKQVLAGLRDETLKNTDHWQCISELLNIKNNVPSLNAPATSEESK